MALWTVAEKPDERQLGQPNVSEGYHFFENVSFSEAKERWNVGSRQFHHGHILVHHLRKLAFFSLHSLSFHINLKFLVNDNIAGTSIDRVSLNEADVEAAKKINIDGRFINLDDRFKMGSVSVKYL